MKYISAIALLIISLNAAFAQAPNSEVVTVLSNGDTRIEGIDPFGAYVAVVYDEDMVKIYQERTLDGETSYIKFEDGRLAEHGTLSKPLYVINKELNED